ncbi:MAG: tetratricopeptide repeat protein, partial [Planctomycetes bacterium]|nr:tetratricopeptide repeat protein [Planctomycetota bacterium]
MQGPPLSAAVRIIGRRRVEASVLWALYLMTIGPLGGGCSGRSPRVIPRPQPAAEANKSEPQREPLPREALLGLDELEPEIAGPLNPPGIDELPKGADALVAEAEEHLKNRKFSEAIPLLMQAVGVVGDSRRIRRDLGMAYVGLNDSDNALKNLKLFLALAPDDLEAQVLVGQFEAARKNYDAAALAFRTALKCSGVDAGKTLVGEALWGLAPLLERKGYHTAALTCYARLYRDIRKHARTYADSGGILRTIALRPEVLLTRQGVLLLRLRRAHEAAAVLERSYRRDCTNVQTAGLMMRALLAAGRFDRAEKLFAELASEPALRLLMPELVQPLCAAAGDKHLPMRLWEVRKSTLAARS